MANQDPNMNPSADPSQQYGEQNDSGPRVKSRGDVILAREPVVPVRVSANGRKTYREVPGGPAVVDGIRPVVR